MANKHVVRATLNKITPGAVRYKEVEVDGKTHLPSAKQDDMLIGTLYFRKSMMPSAPEEVTVTVEWK